VLNHGLAQLLHLARPIDSIAAAANSLRL
jgi:hypothetical protein